jgi:recombination protein RecT
LSPSETTAVATREKVHPIVLALEERSDVIASLLPKGTDVERFKRIVLQSINRNPALRKCTPNSIVDAAAEAARLGLEPSGAIGGAHLVPYGDTAQLIVDYRGLVELARRSGEIAAIDAAIVR